MYFLAAKLGMIVAEMRERMPHDEFVMWSRYYARQGQRRQVGLE